LPQILRWIIRAEYEIVLIPLTWTRVLYKKTYRAEITGGENK